MNIHVRHSLSFFILLLLSFLVSTGSIAFASTTPTNRQIKNDVAAPEAQVVDYLPDIVVRESDLLDHDIVTTIQFGHRNLRLSNGTPNIGDGPLYLRGLGGGSGGGTGGGGNTQPVNQRIYRSDGSFYERLAGQFLYHPQHDHIHVEDWSIYRLRAVTAGNGVGAILATSQKTSFCIVDLEVYNSSLPHYNPNGFFFSCGNAVQGLSVGWTDIYTKDLDGQNIDVTNIPDGVYWLESEVDPDNHFLEKDETNNITRIQVVIGNPGAITPDQYEPDNTFDSVNARIVGAPNSPLLGPCNPYKKINGLGIHQPGDIDIFKFYCNNTGGASDSLSIIFQHSIGDLDLALYNASGNQISHSDGSTNREFLSLNGIPKGWYYVEVYGYLNATNPYYELVIDPPVNNPPAVQITSQASGSLDVIHGFETFPVSWTSSDPENDERWVTVWMNRTPAYTDSAIQIPTSVNTPAAAGFQVINSSYLDTGVYYAGVSITDGGTTTWDWSVGTVHLWNSASLGVISGIVTNAALLPMPDAEAKIVSPSRLDSTETGGAYQLVQLFPSTYNILFSRYGYADTVISGVTVVSGDTTQLDVKMRSSCLHTPGDIDGNGQVANILDLTYIIAYMFNAGPPPPAMETADINGRPGLNILDVMYLISYLFAGGTPPMCP